VRQRPSRLASNSAGATSSTCHSIPTRPNNITTRPFPPKAPRPPISAGRIFSAKKYLSTKPCGTRTQSPPSAKMKWRRSSAGGMRSSSGGAKTFGRASASMMRFERTTLNRTKVQLDQVSKSAVVRWPWDRCWAAASLTMPRRRNGAGARHHARNRSVRCECPKRQRLRSNSSAVVDLHSNQLPRRKCRERRRRTQLRRANASMIGLAT
jgi:hypothetical protein